jgi:3-oxoacyl-[acyl-carrier-protein] synthase III
MKQWRTMGFHAAEKALEMAGVAKEDIGLIVVATTTSSHAFPSSACQVQQMLGIKDCAAFDLAAAWRRFHLRVERCRSVR